MWILLAGLALAQGVDDEARLLGPEPVVTAEAVAGAPSPPSFDLPPWWTVPLVGLGLVVAYKQRQKRVDVDAEAMRVLGRTALGKDASVVMLEVRDAEGGWRRLLLGTSPQGTQLLTELGSAGSFAEAFFEAEATPEPARPIVAEPVVAVPKPVPTIGPARARAAALHGELASLPGVLREPPPVREPTHSVREGLDLLADVRRTKGRLGTRVQAYG